MLLYIYYVGMWCEEVCASIQDLLSSYLLMIPRLPGQASHPVQKAPSEATLRRILAAV